MEKISECVIPGFTAKQQDYFNQVIGPLNSIQLDKLFKKIKGQDFDATKFTLLALTNILIETGYPLPSKLSSVQKDSPVQRDKKDNIPDKLNFSSQSDLWSTSDECSDSGEDSPRIYEREPVNLKVVRMYSVKKVLKKDLKKLKELKKDIKILKSLLDEENK